MRFSKKNYTNTYHRLQKDLVVQEKSTFSTILLGYT